MPMGLDDKVLEALGLLQEECAEIIQIVSKIRRFGLDSYNPYDAKQLSNQALLAHEVGDFQLIYSILIEQGVINPSDVLDRMNWKREKLKKYTTLFKDEEIG